MTTDPLIYTGNCKLTVKDVRAMVPLFESMTDAEISERYNYKVSRDQVRNIRMGRSWASVTGIGSKDGPKPAGTLKVYADRKPNHRQTHPSHPLYKLTMEINEGVGLRVRGLIRERDISNTVAAAALQMTESALSGKFYRRSHNAFSLAQIVIMQRVLFPDVCLVWLLTGVTESDEVPEYVKLQEFYEVELLVNKLKRESASVENQ